MKIAVTSQGRELDSQIDPRFGRAAYILIVDSDTLNFDVFDNSENVNSFKGAGIQAAVNIREKGAEVLLTGFCGPNAFKTLNAAGLKVADGVSGTVREAVQSFLDGKLTFAEKANVEGHW
jgi:predicted Fe-Mo cluster-binding NifX family protein